MVTETALTKQRRVPESRTGEAVTRLPELGVAMNDRPLSSDQKTGQTSPVEQAPPPPMPYIPPSYPGTV